MIVKVAHISSANQNEFVDMVKIAASKMQNEDRLEVEIQYQATPITDETAYVVYSAMLIGRYKK